MPDDSVRRRFTDALDVLIEELKQDRSILAVMLCGSLSHDTVWARSDIDLGIITIDDRKIDRDNSGHGVPLYADGVNVHAFVMSRTAFRRTVEGSLRNSFMHSLLAKGRLLYTHDDTITEMFARLHDMGARDMQMSLLAAATSALPTLYKAHKWLITRADLDYTALWILYTATPLAGVEVISAGKLIDREVVLEAMKLNPEFFRVIYTDILNEPKTYERVSAALEAIDRYIAERAPQLFALVFDYLRTVGDARSSSEIEHHFERHFGISGVTTACEYLADQGLIGKASAPVKVTKKSNIEVEELAFYYIEQGD
jgi:uncharacterized protein